MSVITDLWKLQEVDSALDTRRASLEEAESRLGESEDLVAARERVTALTAELTHARGDQKDVELEADELKAKIGPIETKLYSGSVRVPKELKDMQADIDQLKRHLSAVEDRDLEALTALEAAENALREAKSECDAIEAAWNEEQRDLTEKSARLRGEVATYDAQRAEYAAVIPGDILHNYDRIRRAHQGRAMAKLDRNLCLGCRISLPANFVTKARAGNTLVQCPNCERMLVA